MLKCLILGRIIRGEQIFLNGACCQENILNFGLTNDICMSSSKYHHEFRLIRTNLARVKILPKQPKRNLGIIFHHKRFFLNKAKYEFARVKSFQLDRILTLVWIIVAYLLNRCVFLFISCPIKKCTGSVVIKLANVGSDLQL